MEYVVQFLYLFAFVGVILATVVAFRDRNKTPSSDIVQTSKEKLKRQKIMFIIIILTGFFQILLGYVLFGLLLISATIIIFFVRRENF